jgi:hypothetical protein
MKRTIIPGLLLVVPLAACSGGGAPGGAVRDSAGVAIVENTARGSWGPGGPWQFEEALRIGTPTGEPEYQFGQVVGLDVDDAGNIYVLDQMAQEVRVYDASGKYVRSLGRPGNGPGELSRNASAVLIGRGDTVYVADLMLQRMSRYAPDGSDAGTFPIPLDQGVSARWEMTENNTFLQQVQTIPLPGQTNAAAPVNLILSRATDGTLQDTVLHLKASETVRFDETGPRIRLFQPETVWTLLPGDRIALAVNSTYRIEVHGGDGALQRVITRPFERKQVGEADRQAFLKMFRETWERNGVPAQAIPQLVSAVSFADYYPAFANLLSGPDGSLWVQQIRTADETGAEGGDFTVQDVGSPSWDVFDADGQFLGTVTFPARFTAMRFHGDSVYGLWRDDMDVQHVMVLSRKTQAS